MGVFGRWLAVPNSHPHALTTLSREPRWHNGRAVESPQVGDHARHDWSTARRPFTPPQHNGLGHDGEGHNVRSGSRLLPPTFPSGRTLIVPDRRPTSIAACAPPHHHRITLRHSAPLTAR